MKTHNNHFPPCCGECPYFRNEDIYGFGLCKITQLIQLCFDPCQFTRELPTRKETAKLLHHFQKWRRGGKTKMPAPWLVGLALDRAIQELRKPTKTPPCPNTTTK